MLGYMGEGMETKTAEAIDCEGWLHSGDKGKLDSDGLVFITGFMPFSSCVCKSNTSTIYMTEFPLSSLTVQCSSV